MDTHPLFSQVCHSPVARRTALMVVALVMKQAIQSLLGLALLISMVGCASRSDMAQRQKPNIVATTMKDAKLLLDMGKDHLAEEKLRSVLQAEPDNPEARYYLALAQRAQQENPQRPRGYIQTIVLLDSRPDLSRSRR